MKTPDIHIVFQLPIIIVLLSLMGCAKQNENPGLNINSINPDKGPFGTMVTIDGSGFSSVPGENMVYFNGVLAVVQNATTSQLTVEVPKGAGTGPVRISLNGQTVDGPTFSYEPTANVSTLAGSGLFGGQDGTGLQAYFNHPRGIVASPQGDLYVCDEGGNKIRKVTPAGVVTTLAGSGNAGFTDGAGVSAEFNGPIELEWIPANTLFQGSNNYLLVADSKNNALRSVNLSNKQVTTWAGAGPGYKDGDRSAVQFNLPAGLAFDAGSKTVFISDYINNRIRRYVNEYISTIAGNSTVALTDGYSTQASFAGPAGLALDASGNLYVADWFNHAIRKMNMSLQVTTLAGTGKAGFQEGSGNKAQFNTPSDVALFNNETQLLVTDGFNHRIRLIDLNNNNVNTIAGTGEAGYLDGRGDQAKFNGPVAIAVHDDVIYVSDYFNNRIRKITME